MTRGARGGIALAALIGLIAVPIVMWRLTLTGQTMAAIFAGAPFEALIGVLVLIAALILVRALLQLARDEIGNAVASRLKTRVRAQIYDHILQLGPSYFDQQRSADAAMTLVDGVEQLDQFFGQYVPQLIVAALTPLLIFGFMAFLDVQTALIFLFFALITLIAPAIFHRRNNAASLGFRRAQMNLGAEFLDAIQGLATLKAFGQSGERGRQLADKARALYRGTMWVLAVNLLTGGVTLLGISAGAAVALAWGAVRVQAGELPLSTLLIVLLMGVEVFRPLRDLAQLYHGSMLATAASRGMYQLLDAVPVVSSPPASSPGGSSPADPAPRAQVRGAVTFDRVTFAYQGGRRRAVERCSFELAPGRTLGIVGPSGAGKSTLVNLLLRFADPLEGRVLLNGHDLRTLPLEVLRSQIAVVAQDTYLFHGTVAENLRVAKPDASQVELESACRAANAHAFIADLPRGYDTLIGERGLRLSGGQRQRLAIARALLKDAPILVLDEALSSVDAENEEVIQQALDRLQRGRTTLVIAHRLSSVATADHIVVLERGQVVEEGSPADLMAQPTGAYSRLMAAQRSTLDEPTLPELVSDPIDEAPAEGERLRHRRPAPSAAVPPLPQAQIWMRLFRLVRPLWQETTIVFLLGPLHALSQVALGVVSALLVAQAFTGGSLTPFLWGLAILVPATAILRWLDSWVSHDLAYRLLAELRIRLYRTLDPLAPAYLLKRRGGDLVSALMADVELIELFYAHTISPLVVAILVPAVVLVALFAQAPTLALVLTPFIVGVALTPLLAVRQSARQGSQMRELSGEVTAHAIDSIQGLRTIAAFDYGARRAAEVAGRSVQLGQVKRGLMRWQAIQNTVIEALMGLGGLAVLTVGARLVADNQLARTALPLVMLLAASSFVPVVGIVTVLKELAQTLGGARRYFAVEDEPVVVRDGPRTLVAGAGTSAQVQFEGVTFAYAPEEEPALRDVSFVVPAGKTVALVGRSGAGKTTIAHLILRFWDPQRGRSMVGEQDTRDVRLDDLRKTIALVAQDTYLFNQSLLDNIRLGRPSASDEEVLNAARAANVDEFAQALPEGYETSVGERGMQLSGGQRQRVSIARALLKDAPILVLDEATSHLDAVSEAQVRQALDRLSVGRTTLVIAHRLSTIRGADQILVLDGGRVVEQGTHAELLALDGLYSHLIASQLRAATRPARSDGVSVR